METEEESGQKQDITTCGDSEPRKSCLMIPNPM